MTSSPRRSVRHRELAPVEAHRRKALVALLSSGAAQGDLFAPHRAEERLRQAEDEVERWIECGYQWVTLHDPDYPAQLRTLAQRPPVLFYRGTLQRSDARSIAVIGTRSPTADALRQARTIAEDLTAAGLPVVSGLAAGIDTAVHHAVLRAGGRTIAVIGSGLGSSYPPENRELQEQLATEHLVLSQFWPDSPPTRTTFPLRNAVMSGYARATVVIEAGPRSGARLQARLACRQGRPVFLVRSMLSHAWAREYAARPGTTVVDGATEVLAQLAQPSPGGQPGRS